MRKLALIAAAALAAAGMAAPARAAAVPVNCATNYCVNWQLNSASCGSRCLEYTSQVEWVSNPSPKRFARGHIVCKISTGTQTETRDGGWVTSLLLWSAAHCQTPYVVLRAGWQVKKTSSGAVTTVWGCNPCPAAVPRRG